MEGALDQSPPERCRTRKRGRRRRQPLLTRCAVRCRAVFAGVRSSGPVPRACRSPFGKGRCRVSGLDGLTSVRLRVPARFASGPAFASRFQGKRFRIAVSVGRPDFRCARRPGIVRIVRSSSGGSIRRPAGAARRLVTAFARSPVQAAARFPVKAPAHRPIRYNRFDLLRFLEPLRPGYRQSVSRDPSRPKRQMQPRPCG